MSVRDSLRSIVTFGAPAVTSSASAPEETYEVAAQALPGIGYSAYRPTWPTWDTSTWRETYSRLALIYRCVNIVSHALGTAPIRVYDENDADASLANHRMRQLMRRPNPRMGEAAFWGHVGLRASCAGFCVVEKEYNNAGEVIALWPLQSSLLKAIPRRDSAHDWEYRVPGIPEPFYLEAEKVIPFTYADTATGSPYGVGPLEAALREATLSSAMTDFLKGFFESGAMPLHAIIPEDNAKRKNQDEIDQFLDAFMRRRTGLTNAVRPMYLQNVKDVKRIGFDMNELAYTDLRDISELGIIQAFGIPASVAQIRVGLEHSDSRANAEVDEGKLYRQTIIPLWTRFDDALTLNLLPDFEPPHSTISLEFDLTRIQALQGDRNERAGWLNTAALGGIITVGQWHKELGIKAPAGDDFYLRGIATQAVPADDPFAGAPPPASPPQLSLILNPATLAATSSNGHEPRALPAGGHQRGNAAGYAARYARAKTDKANIAELAHLSAPGLRDFFAAQAERVIPKALSSLEARTLPVSLNDWRTALHERLFPGVAADTYTRLATYALTAADWEAEDKRLGRLLRSMQKAAGDAAFSSIEQNHGFDVGISFDIFNPRVARVMDKVAHRVVNINETTRQDIAGRVASGLREGNTVEEIRDSLRGLFEITYRGRELAVARTESMVMYGEASVLGYKETGLIDRAQVFDNPDHDEDYGASDGLTCAERDGIIVALDDAMDHVYADHPNGSAALAPVLAGED